MDQQQSMDYFKSIPWCASLLSQPGTTTFTPSHKDNDIPPYRNHIASQDQLLRSSLKAPSAVPYCVGFYKESAVVTPSSSPPSAKPNSTFLVTEATLLFSLGNGTKGFSGNVHGGLTGVLIDEGMGNLLYASNRRYQSLKASSSASGATLPGGILDLEGIIMLTAGMNIRLRKPITTPSVVAVVSKMGKIEGRTVFIEVSVEGEGGVVFATGLGEWRMLSLPGKKL